MCDRLLEHFNIVDAALASQQKMTKNIIIQNT